MIDVKKCMEEVNKMGFATGLAELDSLTFASEFGNITPQYNGELLFAVKPDPLMEDYYVSINSKRLYPHTEAYEFETPPKYIILICRKPDKYGLGTTKLCDMSRFLKLLNRNEYKYIVNNKFLFHANSGLKQQGFTKQCFAPMYDCERKIFRYSYNNMEYNNRDSIKKILLKIEKYYEKNYIELLLEDNQFIIIDNYRMVHARTDFLDQNRCIERVWID